MRKFLEGYTVKIVAYSSGQNNENRVSKNKFIKISQIYRFAIGRHKKARRGCSERKALYSETPAV